MFLKALSIASVAAALTTVSAMAGPEVGKTAPDFSVADATGKVMKLSDYRGKTVVLEWTNDECPYVMKHYSSNNMQTLQKEATGKGVVWLSIISSAPGEQGNVDGAKATELTKKRGAAPTAVLLDPEGKTGRLYDAKTTPHMYVVDAKGTLVYMGGIDDKATANVADIKTAKNYVRAALDSIASGKPVENAVTRPYGCSVKYSS